MFIPSPTVLLTRSLKWTKIVREMKQPRRYSSTKGFSRASGLLQSRIKSASEARGFAVTRLLTHWQDIVGEATAQVARPVNVSYGKGGFGATLVLLTTGAQAPMLEMQKEQIREKVNACYGYNAIARVRITQTAPTRFSEGQASFDHAPRRVSKSMSQAAVKQAETLAQDVADEGLRVAIQALGSNVINKSNS